MNTNRRGQAGGWLILGGGAAVAVALSLAPLGVSGQEGGASSDGTGAAVEGSGARALQLPSAELGTLFAGEGSGVGSGLVAPAPGSSPGTGPGGPWLGAEPAPDTDFGGAAEDGGTLLPDRRDNAPDGFPF